MGSNETTGCGLFPQGQQIQTKPRDIPAMARAHRLQDVTPCSHWSAPRSFRSLQRIIFLSVLLAGR